MPSPASRGSSAVTVSTLGTGRPAVQLTLLQRRKLRCMLRLQRDHLETLLAAVDHGTLDAARRALAITPSAVSQRIKAMEQQLGRVLLQRTPPVAPTADGEVVLRHARQARLLDDETARRSEPSGARTARRCRPSRSRSTPTRSARGSSTPSPSCGPTPRSCSTCTGGGPGPHGGAPPGGHRDGRGHGGGGPGAGVLLGPSASTGTGPSRHRRSSTATSPAADTERRMTDRLDRGPARRLRPRRRTCSRGTSAGCSVTPRAVRGTSSRPRRLRRAVSLGFGWGMLPEAQCRRPAHRGARRAHTRAVERTWRCGGSGGTSRRPCSRGHRRGPGHRPRAAPPADLRRPSAPFAERNVGGSSQAIPLRGAADVASCGIPQEAAGPCRLLRGQARSRSVGS